MQSFSSMAIALDADSIRIDIDRTIALFVASMSMRQGPGYQGAVHSGLCLRNPMVRKSCEFERRRHTRHIHRAKWKPRGFS
jgi:hypothetical protein